MPSRPARVALFLSLCALPFSLRAAISYGSPSQVTVGVLGAARTVVADFNGDCIPDIATMGIPPSGQVSVDFGGGATFTHSANYAVTNATSIAVGDFNEDGHPDIVLTDETDATLNLLLNNGSGTFSVGTAGSTGVGPRYLAVGDVNEDGHLDVVTTNSDGTVSVLLGDGHGGFTTSSISTVNSSMNDLVLADVNGDHHLDIAIAAGSDVLILNGHGDGTFDAAYSVSLGGVVGASAIAAGDIDHDGRVDVATANGNVVDGDSVLHNNGGGSWSVTKLAMTSAPTNPISVALVDLDGDGNLDLISATQNGCPPEGSNLAVRPGNGDGTFGAHVAISVGYTNCIDSQFQPNMVAFVDLNCDGKPDLIVPEENKNFVTVLLTSGPVSAPPVGVTAPANITISAGADCTATVADLGTPSTSGGCGSCLTVTRTGVPVGNIYPLGTTTITYHVTDGHTSASATQTVTVNDTTPPAIASTSPITATCNDTITVTPPAATDNCGSATVTGVRSDSQPLSAAYPIGTTTITWTASDTRGNTSTSTQTVTVSPSPVVISGPALLNVVIWPPNHQMVDITLGYATSGGCGSVDCAVASITSNEPTNFLGDGTTPADWQIVDAHHVRVRAERSGTGNGRIYTITIKCTDGNTTATKTVTVTVPKSQK